MLYCNESISAEVRNITNTTTNEDFQVNQITLGTPGPNEKTIIMTCPENTRLMRGMNQDYTIGYTNSYRPRIYRSRDNKLFMLLSSRGENQRGISHLQVPLEHQNEFHVLLHGYGMDILHQNEMVSWDYTLVIAPKSGIISVINDGLNREIYLIHDNIVIRTRPSQLLHFAKTLGITKLPCQVSTQNNTTVLDGNWVSL